MYSINFWLRHQNETKGLTPIYCRIRINGKYEDFATGIKVKKEHFDQNRQRLNLKKNQSYILDNELIERIYEDVKKLIIRNEGLTSMEIKNLYISKDAPTVSPLLSCYFEQYVKDVIIEKKKSSDGTVSKWNNVGKHIKAFCPTLTITEINGDFAERFQQFIMTNFKASNNHAVRSVKCVSNVLDFGVRKGLLTSNVLDMGDVKRDYKNNVFYLEEHQLSQLVKIPLTGKLDEIRDLFIFICFTGFDYCDFKDFDGKRDVADNRIFWNRGKNNNTRIIPLLPEAKRVLEKYDYKLPSVKLHTFNKTLKIFGEWLSLSFPLTTKVGRKTAGTWLLNNGVRLEVVQVILGHKSIRTTEKYYAKILPKTVLKETAHLV